MAIKLKKLKNPVFRITKSGKSQERAKFNAPYKFHFRKKVTPMEMVIGYMLRGF